MSSEFNIDLGNGWVAKIVEEFTNPGLQKTTIFAEAKENPYGLLSYTEEDLGSTEISTRSKLLKMIRLIIALYENL
jgi:hypothetical protein